MFVQAARILVAPNAGFQKQLAWCVCVCVDVCVSVCVCGCVCECVYGYMCVYVDAHVHMRVYVCMMMLMCVCVCVFACVFVYICVCRYELVLKKHRYGHYKDSDEYKALIKETIKKFQLINMIIIIMIFKI